MSENRVLTREEIEHLANSHAEREAFVKSTVVFITVWVVGSLISLFLPFANDLLTRYVVTGFVVSFFAAFSAGLITRWLVKNRAYEEFYAFYSEQQKQETSTTFP